MVSAVRTPQCEPSCSPPPREPLPADVSLPSAYLAGLVILRPRSDRADRCRGAGRAFACGRRWHHRPGRRQPAPEDQGHTQGLQVRPRQAAEGAGRRQRRPEPGRERAGGGRPPAAGRPRGAVPGQDRDQPLRAAAQGPPQSGRRRGARHVHVGLPQRPGRPCGAGRRQGPAGPDRHAGPARPADNDAHTNQGNRQKEDVTAQAALVNAERDIDRSQAEIRKKIQQATALRDVRAQAKEALDAKIASLLGEAAVLRNTQQQTAANQSGQRRTGTKCDLSGTSDAEYWIIMHESGGDPTAANPNSTAFGLGQLLLGADYDTIDCGKQLSAFRSYVRERYGTAENAKAFWIAHGWY